MRKRLLALLSLAGLASSSTPGTSQVLKGASAGPETKNESQVKDDKANQEKAAVQDDASKTMRKAGGEQQANKDVVTEKVGPDHSDVKMKYIKRAKVAAENNATHDAAQNKKFVKSSAETNAGKTQAKAKFTNADAPSKDAAKLTKASTENTAIHESKTKKVKTVTGESDAVKNETGNKDRKAGKEHDALTVKQKATVDAGAGKAKFDKNAAETKAAQQNLEQKADKATPKPTPK